MSYSVNIVKGELPSLESLTVVVGSTFTFDNELEDDDYEWSVDVTEGTGVAEWKYDMYFAATSVGKAQISASLDGETVATYEVTVVEPYALDAETVKNISLESYYKEIAYTFTPEASGIYYFKSFGETADPRLEICDSEGTEIASNDDAYGYNFIASAELEAGETYTLNIYLYSGSSFDMLISADDGDIRVSLSNGLYDKDINKYIFIAGIEAYLIYDFGDDELDEDDVTFECETAEELGLSAYGFCCEEPGEYSFTVFIDGAEIATFDFIVIDEDAVYSADYDGDGDFDKDDVLLLRNNISNGVKTGPFYCNTDINGDGKFDETDIEYACEIYGFEFANEGDANGNGIVNMLDVIALRRYLLNSETYPVAYKTGSDADGSGSINMLDVIAVRRYLLNSEKYPLG